MPNPLVIPAELTDSVTGKLLDGPVIRLNKCNHIMSYTTFINATFTEARCPCAGCTNKDLKFTFDHALQAKLKAFRTLHAAEIAAMPKSQPVKYTPDPTKQYGLKPA